MCLSVSVCLLVYLLVVVVVCWSASLFACLLAYLLAFVYRLSVKASGLQPYLSHNGVILVATLPRVSVR